MLLCDIVTISSGYLFRRKLEPEAGGRYRIIQMKDITDENCLDTSSLDRVDIKSVKPGHYLFETVVEGFTYQLSRDIGSTTLSTQQHPFHVPGRHVRYRLKSFYVVYNGPCQFLIFVTGPHCNPCRKGFTGKEG